MRPPLPAAAGLLAILIAIYGPGIGKGFVKDDVVWVSNNHVTSWQDVRALVLRTDGFYRPLVAATFAVDRAAYGVEPFGFGVTNLLLLVAGAAALANLGVALGLGRSAAVVAAGVWALNFHAVNMAVLWLSGRTALCVSIAAFLAAACLVRRQPMAAGTATLLAMFAKEEAVMLPLVFAGWAWVLAGRSTGPALRTVIRQTWPAWVAAGIYLAIRAQTAAMTPMSATSAYQFVTSPGALAGNALEYIDRACTFSLIVLVLACLLAWKRPSMTPSITRVVILGAIWMAGTYSLTVFVPNRSSLYALLPSAAPALIAGFVLQHLWTQSTPARQRWLVAAAVMLPLAALPVYWSRNVRWTEIAELSADTFGAVRHVSRERPDVTMLVFRDDPGTRRSFANTYDELLPVAVRLAAGRDIRGELETRDTASAGAVRIVLRDRKVLVE
jgi:hypothetical protein